MRLRPVTVADHAQVLDLNERHVELLAPLDEARLVQLQVWARTAAVIDVDGSFAGFVLTFAAESAYDGENFAWFRDRFADREGFGYLDRIVIADDFRRRGLASLVYDELETPLFTLEVNLDPPNEASLAFHRARGYVEVGQRTSGGHLVSLLARGLS